MVFAPAREVPACCHINTGGILQSAGHQYHSDLSLASEK